MKTYQDLQAVVRTGDNDQIMEFVRRIIGEYCGSDMYVTAVTAEDYYKKQNTTIMQYEKTITTITGRQITDEYSANHKVVSGFFKRFVTQQVSFSLGNGVSFDDNSTKDKLGGVKFDRAVQQAGKWACIGGVAYMFWNLDHVEVFKAKEFVPLLDETNGALRAGVKFWRLDEKKPLRAILYEEDGYTEFMWNNVDENGKKNTKGEIVGDGKTKGYISISKTTEADDETDVEWKNYGSFPIVPLWANEERQSELVGIREGIDAYDLIKNGFENELDSAQMYWIIKGAGGMEDPDLAHFLDRLKKLKVAAPMDDQTIEPVTINLPYQARQTLLAMIENDLYRDFMVVNTDNIASGAVTATQIRASYSPQEAKADDFEYQVGEAIEAVMELAGVEDKYGFERGYIINVSETIQNTLAAAQTLPQDYVVKKILTAMGDGDMADDIIDEMAANELEQMQLAEEQAQAENEETGAAIDEYGGEVADMLEALLKEFEED